MTTRAARVSVFASALLAAWVVCASAAARAADDQPLAIDAVGAHPSRGPGLWQVSAGWRESLVRSSGFDPYSDNDVLAQFVLTATRAFRTGPRLATAVGGLWEAGNAQAAARAEAAQLSVTRLGVVVEERFAPRPWGYAYARVAPAWLHAAATLADMASPEALGTSFDTYSVDASAGLAARLNPVSQTLGLWAVAEAGYGWVAPQTMALSPALPAADKSKAGATPFDDLDLSGVLMRFAIALSY